MMCQVRYGRKVDTVQYIDLEVLRHIYERGGLRKKKKKCFILLCCLVFVTGCGKAKKENVTIGKMGKEDIVATFSGVFDYGEVYPSITSLSENSEIVIYGEVSEVEYLVGENGLCRTNIMVKVLQSLKGDYKVGDMVKVVKDQGITTVNDYIESFSSEEAKELNRKDFSQYSDDDLDNLYIQQIEEKDVMSEIGQKSVYFLEKSSFYDTEETFARLTGPEAEYTEVSDNQFLQTQVVGSELTQPYTLNTFEGKENDGEVDFYTLDEIISEINIVN